MACHPIDPGFDVRQLPGAEVSQLRDDLGFADTLNYSRALVLEEHISTPAFRFLKNLAAAVRAAGSGRVENKSGKDNVRSR